MQLSPGLCTLYLLVGVLPLEDQLKTTTMIHAPELSKRNQDINDVEDWGDYLRWCDSQGFGADEIGYNFIIQYVQFRLENTKQK